MKKLFKRRFLTALAAFSLISNMNTKINAFSSMYINEWLLTAAPIFYGLFKAKSSSSNAENIDIMMIKNENFSSEKESRPNVNDLKVHFVSWNPEDWDKDSYKKLKELLDRNLDYLNSEKAQGLYSYIKTYKYDASVDHTQIEKDIDRSCVPGMPTDSFIKLTPVLRKVLHFVHDKTNIPYYQGFNLVCSGLAYLIHNYYPDLDENMILKLCSHLYFSILPDLQKYSSIFSNYIDNNESHPIIKKAIEKLSNEFKEKNIKKEEIENHVRSQCAVTLCSYGIPNFETETGECNYHSVGSKLVTALIFRASNIITSDSLEELMCDVLYSQCYEFINSYPTY